MTYEIAQYIVSAFLVLEVVVLLCIRRDQILKQGPLTLVFLMASWAAIAIYFTHIFYPETYKLTNVFFWTFGVNVVFCIMRTIDTQYFLAKKKLEHLEKTGKYPDEDEK